MRKEYVKPTMESEEFVANEYVAACWTVACNKCDAIEEGYDSLKNSVKSETYLGKTMNIYDKTLGSKKTCQKYDIPNTEPEWNFPNIWPRLLWEIFVDGLGMDPGSSGSVKYHEVSVLEGWTVTNHPNASV